MSAPTLKKPLLSLATLVVLLGASELGLRAAGYEYSPLDVQVTKPGEAGDAVDWRDQHAFEDRHFRFHPRLIWEPRPGESVFNAQGFRGREFADPKPDGSYYVFAIGDSNTLCNAGGSHWPGYLEQRLRQADPRVRVVNAGVWGYTSFQGLERLEQVLRFEPDLVLVSFGANDAHRVGTSDAEYVARRNLLAGSLYRVRLVQVAVELLDRLRERGGDGELVPRVTPEAYRACLEQMVDRCRERGVEVVLLTRPFIGKSHHPLWWKNFAPEYNALTLAVAEERGVPAIDVHALFAGEREHFVGESHFNDRGNRRMAQRLAERLPELTGVRGE